MPQHTHLLTAFAVLALVLAATGVFGTIYYSVVQRTHEIGIRIALGARRQTVLAMVLREALRLSAAGVGLGLAAVLASTQIIATLLFGVTPHDPATFAAVALGLTPIAVAACSVPAAHAARVDPIVALRAE